MHEHERNPENNFVMSGKQAAGAEREESYDYASGGATRKSMKPIVIAGAGLLLAVIVVLMFISGAPKTADKDQLKGIEARLKSMEEKMVKLEWIDTGLARLDRKEKELAALSERTLQLESALNRRLDQVSRDMPKPQAKPSEPAVAKPESPTTKPDASAPKPGSTAPAKADKDSKTRLHVVQKGETLYGISRKYGVPADQLLKLNKLTLKDPIKPGQQLVLGPAKTG